MARNTPDRSTPRHTRDQLSEVSAFVRQAGRPDLAPAVDAVLAPGGWEILRDTDPVAESGKENLAFPVPKSVRDQINAALKADPDAKSLTAKVTEGLRKYLAGEFTLLERDASRPVIREQWVNMNTRVYKQLKQQVAEKVRREVEDRRASPARVAAEYLMFSYRVGLYAPDQEGREVLPRGAQRNLRMPRRIRDLVSAGAAGSGDRVSDVVNEGFRKFLEGRFDPEPVVWEGEDLADMTVLAARPADALFDQVKTACKTHPVLNAKTGPTQVAVAYLLDEFGLSATE